MSCERFDLVEAKGGTEHEDGKGVIDGDGDGGLEMQRPEMVWENGQRWPICATQS